MTSFPPLFFSHFQITKKAIKVTYRFCAANQADFDKKCDMVGKIICESCTTDGCNSAAMYGPIALFVVIPLAIAKILLF